jgi:hypothetical protein
MQFSPFSCHLISLWSKCSPQQPALKHFFKLFFISNQNYSDSIS